MGQLFHLRVKPPRGNLIWASKPRGSRRPSPNTYLQLLILTTLQQIIRKLYYGVMDTMNTAFAAMYKGVHDGLQVQVVIHITWNANFHMS